MGGAVLLVGPFVALVGLVSVFFVMRHRSVQTKSMYSSRRGQIERKVRAARQRTLAPTGRHDAKAAAAIQEEFAAPGMAGQAPAPTANWSQPPAPSATWGPPAAAPTPEPVPPPAQQAWDVGPTAPAASAPSPTFEASEAPYVAPPVEPVWTPAPAPEPVAPKPVEPEAHPFERASTSAGGGASWSIVSDSSATAAEPHKKDKKGKKDAQTQTGSWQLASGDAPGDEGAEEIKRPSTAMALAQYAVLVVGLVMVLIGVVVMVANAHVT